MYAIENSGQWWNEASECWTVKEARTTYEQVEDLPSILRDRGYEDTFGESRVLSRDWWEEAPASLYYYEDASMEPGAYAKEV